MCDVDRLSVDIFGQEFWNSYIVITGSERMRVKHLLTMTKKYKAMLCCNLLVKINEYYEFTLYVFRPSCGRINDGNR